MNQKFQFENSNKFQGGVGLRPTHYPYLETNPKTIVQWFEVISENYMDTEGRPLAVLERIRKDYPIALHGVSLSIGSPDPIDLKYLTALKKLINRIEPFLISDHFCWTGAHGENLHDLLPIPLNKSNLNRVINKINQVQDFLQKEILLENASSYINFQDSIIPEWEFNTEVSNKTGCGLLLDINNVYVTSFNFGLNPLEYLDNIPTKKVGQIHLAGHSDMGNYLFDTHSKPVQEVVWNLFKYYIRKCPEVPVLIEWDQDIPEFKLLETELKKAIDLHKEILNENSRDRTSNKKKNNSHALFTSDITSHSDPNSTLKSTLS